MNFNDFKEKNKQQEEKIIKIIRIMEIEVIKIMMKRNQNIRNNGRNKQTGYRNEAKTVLRKELVSTEAENIAKELPKKRKLAKISIKKFNEINKLKSKYIEGN